MNDTTPELPEMAPETAPETPPEAPASEPTPTADATPVASDAAAAPAAASVDVAAQLKALFPALFTGGHKPLKLRIQSDIQERAPGQFSKAQLSAFFRRYTGNTGYLIALTKAKTRFDLDGQEAGELSDEHRNAAKEELARRKGLQQERMAAVREEEQLLNQQRYNRAGLLRDFERTTLTLKNFCTLKGVTEEELPGLLDIARKERAEMPPREERPQHMQRPERTDRREPRDRPNERPNGRPQRNNERR